MGPLSRCLTAEGAEGAEAFKVDRTMYQVGSSPRRYPHPVANLMRLCVLGGLYGAVLGHLPLSRNSRSGRQLWKTWGPCLHASPPRAQRLSGGNRRCTGPEVAPDAAHTPVANLMDSAFSAASAVQSWDTRRYRETLRSEERRVGKECLE